MNISLRQLTPNDGTAYSTLIANSPDTGAIRIAPHFEIDPYQALLGLHADTVGIVAETPGYDGFIGSGLIRFGKCQWEGTVRPYALLNTLVVHPDFRRKGVASQIAKWRIEHARRRFGDDGVIFAIIQKNNTGSELTARKWYRQFLPDRLTIIPMKLRSTPPAQASQFIVRKIEAFEFEAVAERLNLFYGDYNLYSPETGESLSTWCTKTLFDTPIHHYMVVTDTSNNILGGLGLAEYGRLRTLVISHLPETMRYLNKFLKIMPESGIIRELSTSRVWFAPGQFKAARYLLDVVRWEWREKGTSLVVFSDTRSPLMEVYRLRPWTIKSMGGFAVHGPTNFPEDRLLYYA